MVKSKSIKLSGYLFVVFLISVIGFCSIVSAEEIGKRMKAIIKAHEKNIKEWVNAPLLIESVKEQNNKKTSLEEIKRIDKDWVAGKADDFAIGLQKNKAGDFLHTKMIENTILYAEMFLCDNQGAVVGEYPKTSDYWQGDEDKFIKCFNNGNGQVYIGPLEFDESSKTNSVQIALPVFDNGKTIGVLVVGLKNIK
ncbi:MAG: hypothetical protein C0403_10805 [Desulfobacterium sp.]|nr:hypothetical protein [Desulfobacterium sp.]